MADSFLGGLIAQPFIALALLFGLLLASVELGSLFDRRRQTAEENDSPGTGAINGAIFALMGLILAFSFSGAASRFETRRDLIVTEANAIGTAQLRIDIAPADAQPALRDAFKRYVDSRITAYAQISDAAKFRAALRRSGAIQTEIWNLAIAAGRRPDALPATNMLLLPALNDMIDITATRAFATLMHPPPIVHVMLIGLALVSGFLAGIGLSNTTRHAWVHPISYALIMTMAIYITIDMEYPRAGFIRVDSFEKAVVDFSRGA
nr:hypothetical protein [Polymorphobacter sp.]